MEAMTTVKSGGGASGEERADAVEEMRAVVELLARKWPDEYPAGAVEWLLLEPHRVRRALENVVHGA
jgi:hypothetical protein